MEKQKPKIKIFYFLFFAIFGFLFLSLNLSVLASECEDNCKISPKCAVITDPEEKKDCQEDCEDECKKLDEKAKIYEKILDLNEKQQDTLSNQLDYINQQQAVNQQDIKEINAKMNELSQKIENLKRDIAEKEKVINYQKKILSGLMQSYYEYDQQGILDFIINENDMSGINQLDYIEQAGVKVSDVLNEIKEGRQALKEAQDELEKDHYDNSVFKDTLESKKYTLQSSENQKQSLLQKTQGEEQKYQDLLSRIEEQKLELFNFSGASNLGEILDSVKNYPKPDKKYWASTSWYFSQRDSRWGKQRIGNSKSLMEDYGCAVSSVAMVFRKMGSSTDPGKMAKEKIFYYDLIKWPTEWSPGIELVSSVSHGNISWSKINSEIKDGHPVIVYIKKTNGRGGHYVVITGKDKKDYIVHDPYFGSNLYLGTSKSLIGKLGADSNTNIDQMIIYN